PRTHQSGSLKPDLSLCFVVNGLADPPTRCLGGGNWNPVIYDPSFRSAANLGTTPTALAPKCTDGAGVLRGSNWIVPDRRSASRVCLAVYGPPTACICRPGV